jgi:transcriptional regulator with XRE-family HTH domain
VNERLKPLRKALGLTQRQFANQLGVTDGAIAYLELGKRKLTEQMMLAICKIFNISYEWLKNGEGEMYEQSPADEVERFCNEQNINIYARSVLKAYLELNEPSRKIFETFIERVGKMTEQELETELLPKPKSPPTIEELIEQKAVELLKQRELEANTPMSEASSLTG